MAKEMLQVIVNDPWLRMNLVYFCKDFCHNVLCCAHFATVFVVHSFSFPRKRDEEEEDEEGEEQPPTTVQFCPSAEGVASL